MKSTSGYPAWCATRAAFQRRRSPRWMGSLLLLLALSAACPAPSDAPSPPAPTSDAGAPTTIELGAKSTRNELLWKRYRAFEQGLVQALLVDEADLCNELGRFSCVDTVHLVVLGGNNPFDQGLHEPVQAPAATTPLAVERVVFSACRASVAADLERAAARVFLDLPLGNEIDPLDPNDEAQGFAVEDTITNLYRRIHARDPLEVERKHLRELVYDDDGQPVLAREFALSACFAVASTTENLFY